MFHSAFGGTRYSSIRLCMWTVTELSGPPRRRPFSGDFELLAGISISSGIPSVSELVDPRSPFYYFLTDSCYKYSSDPMGGAHLAFNYFSEGLTASVTISWYLYVQASGMHDPQVTDRTSVNPEAPPGRSL